MKENETPPGEADMGLKVLQNEESGKNKTLEKAGMSTMQSQKKKMVPVTVSSYFQFLLSLTSWVLQTNLKVLTCL